jgi:hypothetical protein
MRTHWRDLLTEKELDEFGDFEIFSRKQAIRLAQRDGHVFIISTYRGVSNNQITVKRNFIK